jgi:hypothetical protein
MRVSFELPPCSKEIILVDLIGKGFDYGEDAG